MGYLLAAADEQHLDGEGGVPAAPRAGTVGGWQELRPEAAHRQ
jgi:hypothetical protein